MDKVIGMEDIKGLEEEIDSAVDRLFVEKNAAAPEIVSKSSRPQAREQTFQVERDFEMERAELPAAASASSSPTPILKSLEKMEGQLLSLEWEINKDNLSKTKEEVLSLKQTLKERPEAGSILNLMDKVLAYMLGNEEKIRPALVKFLMDCKETLKLVMRKEMDPELKIYKELAYMGIQARFSGLEEFRDAKAERPAPQLRDEIEKAAILVRIETQIGELLKQVGSFLTKMDELTQKMESFVTKMDQRLTRQPQPSAPVQTSPITITVFKVEGRWLGVESDKVYKLFKVPVDRKDRYVDQQKIRLKDFDVRLIDLRKTLSIPRVTRQGEMKILAVKDNGEYKGLMVDQVLERVSTQMEMGGDYGEYCRGVARWTYEEHPIEIGILDLKKF